MKYLQLDTGDSQSPDKLAIAPEIKQPVPLILTTGDGPQDLLPPIATGEAACIGGIIHNPNCYDLVAHVLFVTGDNCGACAPAELTTELKDVIIKKRSVVQLEGCIAGVNVEPVVPNLATGAWDPYTLVADDDDMEVQFESCAVPGCGGAILVPGAGRQAAEEVKTP